MGWTAARDTITPEGWALFAILCFWQLPHFYAIAWIYREEYGRAGFVMLPFLDGPLWRTCCTGYRSRCGNARRCAQIMNAVPKRG